MKALPEDFLYTIDVVIPPQWSDGRTVSLRNVKLDMTRKSNSTFIPNGTSSKFTNIYRSPRLAGSLALSCGNSREYLRLSRGSPLTGEDATAQRRCELESRSGSPDINLFRGYSTFIKVSTAPFAMSR